MAVIERVYKRYEGALAPDWSRFLIIPRHAFRDVFRSKIFTGIFILSYVFPLVWAILIYLHHNANAIAILGIKSVTDIIPIDASFFNFFVSFQGVTGFFLAMLIGPSQVSKDLTNNALPLYLCRPFSRAEYVVGKMSIVIILLSAITWVPGLMLFILQSSLEGWSWFSQNLWIASAIFIGSLVWILLLALLTQAISAWVKWRVASRAALLAAFFIPTAFAALVNDIFRTRWGHIFDLQALIGNIWAGLFGRFQQQYGYVDRFGVEHLDNVFTEPPLWASWLVVFLICAACLWLLSRKVKAYEVVK
jgi:ABC-2 type transport system permease protein